MKKNYIAYCLKMNEGGRNDGDHEESRGRSRGIGRISHPRKEGERGKKHALVGLQWSRSKEEGRRETTKKKKKKGRPNYG